MQSRKAESKETNFDAAARSGFVPLCMMLTRKPTPSSHGTGQTQEVQDD